METAAANSLLAEARKALSSCSFPSLDELRLSHGLPETDPAMPQVVRQLARHADALRCAVSIGRRLDEAALSYLVLKGPLLQEMLYGDGAIRPYGDVDILVPRGRLNDARRILSRAGFRNRSLPGLRSLHFHDVWTNDGATVPVELHWSLLDRANFFRIADADVLSRRRCYTVPGGALAGPDPEDLLVYLCLHAAKHGFLNEVALASGKPASWFLNPGSGNRLIWFVDIALQLRQRLDPARLREQIAAWNVRGAVSATLRVLAMLLPGSGAERTSASLGLSDWRPRSGSRWERAAIDSLAEGTPRMNGTLKVRPARLAQLPRLLFPGSDELRAFHRCADAGAVRRARHVARMIARLAGWTQ